MRKLLNDFVVDRLGEVLTLLVYSQSNLGFSSHTFFYVCVLVHDHQCYHFICSKDQAVVVLQIVQGLPFFFGYIGFWQFSLTAVVGKLIFDFGVVFHIVSSDSGSIFTQGITNVLSSCNLVYDGG